MDFEQENFRFLSLWSHWPANCGHSWSVGGGCDCIQLSLSHLILVYDCVCVNGSCINGLDDCDCDERDDYSNANDDACPCHNFLNDDSTPAITSPLC